jgi:hypothetical protein
VVIKQEQNHSSYLTGSEQPQLLNNISATMAINKLIATPAIKKDQNHRDYSNNKMSATMAVLAI